MTRQEQQIDQTGQASDLLIDLLAKCLRGLATGQQRLPPEIARRALELLWYVLTRLRVTGEGMGPLMAALGFREFAPAAEELERRLASSTDEPTRVQILDTLIAMKAPNLPDVTFRWAASDRWPALRVRAMEWIVAHASIETLPQFPNALKPIAYRIAIEKGIRFLAKRPSAQGGLQTAAASRPSRKILEPLLPLFPVRQISLHKALEHLAVVRGEQVD